MAAVNFIFNILLYYDSGEWTFVSTELTDKGGKVNLTIPKQVINELLKQQ